MINNCFVMQNNGQMDAAQYILEDSWSRRRSWLRTDALTISRWRQLFRIGSWRSRRLWTGCHLVERLVKRCVGLTTGCTATKFATSFTSTGTTASSSLELVRGHLTMLSDGLHTKVRLVAEHHSHGGHHFAFTQCLVLGTGQQAVGLHRETMDNVLGDGVEDGHRFQRYLCDRSVGVGWWART